MSEPTATSPTTISIPNPLDPGADPRPAAERVRAASVRCRLQLRLPEGAGQGAEAAQRGASATVRDEVEGVRFGHCGVLGLGLRRRGLADVAAAGGVPSPCARAQLPISQGPGASVAGSVVPVLLVSGPDLEGPA
jgi:hypothetical protein